MSIATEIASIKSDVAAAYTAAAAKGATMPEVRGTRSLAATVDSIPAGGRQEEVDARSIIESLNIQSGDRSTYIVVNKSAPSPFNHVGVDLGMRSHIEIGHVEAGVFVADETLADANSIRLVVDSGAGYSVVRATPVDESKTYTNYSEPTWTKDALARYGSASAIAGVSLGKGTYPETLQFGCINQRGKPYLEYVDVSRVSCENTYDWFCYGLISLKGIKFGPNFSFNSNIRSFSYCLSLTHLDMSGVAIDSSLVSNFASNASCLKAAIIPALPQVNTLVYLFSSCYSLERVTLPDKLATASDCSSMFSLCNMLPEVVVPEMPNVTKINRMFYECYNLRSVTFNGSLDKVTSATEIFTRCSALTHAPNGIPLPISFNIAASNYWTHEALVNIVNSLPVVTTAQTLTMNTKNLAKLTDEEKQIALDKGWTLA